MVKTYTWDDNNFGSIVAVMVQTARVVNISGQMSVILPQEVYDALIRHLMQELKLPTKQEKE